MLAPESALGLLPSIALSSAQAGVDAITGTDGLTTGFVLAYCLRALRAFRVAAEYSMKSPLTAILKTRTSGSYRRIRMIRAAMIDLSRKRLGLLDINYELIVLEYS